MNAIILGLVTFLGAAPLAPAAIIGTNSQARPLTLERIASLPADQRSVWQKFLSDSQKQLRADQEFLVAEMKRHGLTASLPAPKDTRENRLSLRQPAESYGSPEALRVADVVISFQTPAGGWCKGVDVTHNRRVPGGQFFGDFSTIRLGGPDAPRVSDWHFIGTFDNNATITQLRYLAKVTAALEPRRAAPYRAAFLHGMEYILAAQLPNGGWPQVWPLSGDYHDAITYNDGAMVNVLELLEDVAGGRNEFAFTPRKLRRRAIAAVDRGVDCILKTQIIVNGQRTVWGQQHDVLDLKPTAARNYEMPAASSSESAAIVSFLMKRPKPTPEIVAAVHDAVAWLEKTKMNDLVWEKVDGDKKLTPSPGAEPLWARYYELGSWRPIFGDRDMTIHDDVREISAERRNGYGWFTVGPNRALPAYTPWSQSHPAPRKN